VVSVDARRDISDVSWSYKNPDHIAVSFSFAPFVHVYDLNEPHEAKLVRD
jgi:hypothetical protein